MGGYSFTYFEFVWLGAWHGVVCNAIGTAQSVSLTIANWYQFMKDIQMFLCVCE